MIDLILKIQPLMLFGILIYGGLGGQNYNFIIATLIWVTASFLSLIIRRKNIYYPPGFYLYMIFLIFFALNLFWTTNFWNTFWYLLLFSSGFLFWILAYNLKKEFRNFYKIIILLGILFGILTLYFHFTNPTGMDSFSLHKMATVDHHNIADLWATVIPVLLILILRKDKNKLLLLTLFLFGSLLLFISKSRASLVSLLAGNYYIFSNFSDLKKYLKIFIILALVCLFVFLFFASSKPTLPNRGYYLQGAAGIIRHPLGIGVGNFGVFSGDPKNHLFGYNDYSSVGMNLLMEIFAGLGIFGLIFLIWFIKINLSVFNKPKDPENIYRVIFLVLTTNFMLHFAYLIPTMLWLWFITLGLSQD